MNLFIKGPSFGTSGKRHPSIQNHNLLALMRIGSIILSVFFLGTQLLSASPGLGQKIEDVPVTLELKNESLQAALKKIEKNTGFFFAYQTQQVAPFKSIDLPKQTRSISATLKLILANTNLSFRQDKNYIILYQKEANPGEAPNQPGVLPTPSIGEYMTKVVLKGLITNSKGEAVYGASVVARGMGTGTSTDAGGRFALTVTENGHPIVLEISAVGFKPQTYTYDGSPDIRIVLKEAPAGLNDVIVVGYGEQKKINLTGAVVALDAKQIENRGEANISNILAGQAPGLTVLQRGGTPGNDAGSLNIRGVGTLGNSNPLIVVDGIETDDYTQINPNDIASISILKDASSSAIYGINAANGVIIITTKRGVKGKIKFDYNVQYGGSAFDELPKKVNSYDLAILYNEGQINDGSSPSALKFSTTDIQEFKDGSNPVTHANSNWTKAIFSEPGTWNSHNLSLSGGTDDTKYNVSFGYLDQGGIMESTGYKRYTFRVNLDQKITNWLSMGMNLALTNRSISNPPTVLGVGGATWYLHEAFQAWANDPIKFPDGRWAYPAWSGLNSNSVAYASSQNGTSSNNNNRLLGTVFAELKIIDGLKLKGVASTTQDFNYASDVGLGVNLYPFDPQTGAISPTPNNTSASMPAVPSTTSVYRGFYRGNLLNLQAFLNYKKVFRKHELKVLLGFEQVGNTEETEDITRINLSDASLNQLNAASPLNQSTDGNTIQYRSRSYFGRLNYIFASKYLFEADLRNDATSRFAPERRQALFPAFSAGWIISREKFFQSSLISNLKLRGSWGILGNQQIADYLFLQSYQLGANYPFNGTLTPGIAEGPLANPGITWEKTTSKNIGIDLSLWNNKFSISGDYYIRDTKNILLQLSQPSILGATPPEANAGSVRNTGYEFNASYKDRKGKVGYYINGNFAYVHNQITNLAGAQYPGFEVGDPVYNLYGYAAEGIFQNQAQISKHPDQSAIGTPQPGDIMFKDLNGDGKVDANDRKNLGSYFPSINYGLSLGVNYQGFDLSTVWQGVADVKAYLGGRLTEPFGDFGSSPIVQELDRWTPDGKNPNARFPRESFAATYNNIESSWWVFNTSFLKLRNVQLGYTIPASMMSKWKILKLRFYVSGENLLTISPFKIMDPETVTSGDPFFGYAGNNAYPTTKRYLAGISLTF